MSTSLFISIMRISKKYTLNYKEIVSLLLEFNMIDIDINDCENTNGKKSTVSALFVVTDSFVPKSF